MEAMEKQPLIRVFCTIIQLDGSLAAHINSVVGAKSAQLAAGTHIALFNNARPDYEALAGTRTRCGKIRPFALSHVCMTKQNLVALTTGGCSMQDYLNGDAGLSKSQFDQYQAGLRTIRMYEPD